MNKIAKHPLIKKTIVIVIFLLIISPFIYNQVINIKKKNLDYNKRRLIELSISREKIFWNCHREQLIIENEKWMNTDDYIGQNSFYKQCLEDSSSQVAEQGMFFLGRLSKCKDLVPDNRWNQSNEIASKHCSQVADESEDGRLKDEFRKKVPATALTNNEIAEKVKEAIK